VAGTEILLSTRFIDGIVFSLSFDAVLVRTAQDHLGILDVQSKFWCYVISIGDTVSAIRRLVS
jgi:hypothetical protein